ncbi:MAG TPA: NAD(P)-dependent oxidoreductase [Vicinamibacterales bacterium]|nr:NAD(P)-dependent oxidoreductase [Vicinamibacterales bacterium]
MTETILVTGAAGFVGGRLVPALQRGGFTVVSHGRADGDLAEAPPTTAATCVVHLAGRTFVPESWTDPLAFYRDNTLATGGVLEYCRRTGARLVHLSSYVYGPPEHLPVAESHPRRAFNPYALSKILAEDLIAFHEARFGLKAAVIRPFNLYGPGQDERFLIPTIIRQIVNPDCASIVVRDVQPKRDYLFVDDIVELILPVVRSGATGVFNAGSGRSVSVAGIIDMLASLAGISKPVSVSGDVRPGEVMDVVADTAAAARAFGWTPRVSLRDGLGITLDAAKRRHP